MIPNLLHCTKYQVLNQQLIVSNNAAASAHTLYAVNGLCMIGQHHKSHVAISTKSPLAQKACSNFFRV